MAWPRALAQLATLVALAMCAAAALLAMRWPGLDVTAAAVGVLAALPAVGLGALVAVKRPGNRIAPLLCLVGAAPIAVLGLGEVFAEAVRRHPGTIAVPPWYAGLSEAAWMWLYVPVALLMLLFPDGRLPGRRWRWAVAGLLAVPVAFALLALGSPAPYREPFQTVPSVFRLPPSVAGPAAVVLLAGFLALLITSAAAMIVRYTRAGADPVLRAQLRLFALGAAALPATLVLCWIGYLVWGVPDLAGIALILTALAVPAAAAVGLLRHDLYDLDRVLAATATYGCAVILLLAGFGGAAALSGVLLGRDSPVLAALITACCALALAPLRARIQRRVDRRLYPRRHTLRAAILRLRTDVDSGAARPEELQATLRAVLDDPGLRVAYRMPGRPALVDADGTPFAAGSRAVEVTLGGIAIGALLPGTAGASRHLLTEAAAGSAILVELIRGRLQIQAALADVAASRARLLRAGYAERTRLQRDLHDGAQQRLVSLGVTLRLAQRHLNRDEAGAEIDGLIDAAVAELGTAVAELRAIAHGLRPAALDSGLAPALQALTATMPIPVRLSVWPDPVPDVPDITATTAYYVASEALANIVKHAGAASADLRVTSTGGTLTVRITDDGQGGARPRAGSGLAGLADRVSAAGGRLAVTDTGRAGPRGTVLEAVLPCAP